jgi:hypothetical protein
MEAKSRLGMAMSAVGTATIVLAILLFGVRDEGGGTDWVSVITAAAGLVMAAVGMLTLFRYRGGSGGHTPHTAS